MIRNSFFFERSDGQVQISTTVPDTITSWIASAFAINSASGLGIADTTAKVSLNTENHVLGRDTATLIIEITLLRKPLGLPMRSVCISVRDLLPGVWYRTVFNKHCLYITY